MKLKSQNIFDLVLALVACIFLVVSLGYDPRARLVPLVVAVPTLTLLLFQILGDTVPAVADRLRFIYQGGIFSSSRDSGPPPQEKKESEPWPWRILLWLCGFCAALYVLSYLVVVPLFVFLLTLVEGREKPLKALLLAAGTGMFIFLLFDVLLKASF